MLCTSLFCCVEERLRMVNRGPGWSPFSGLPGHTVKSADRRRALSFQPNLRRRSALLSVLGLVCGCRRLWNCPHTYWRGLLRNPPVCSFFIQSALLSLFTSECQSLPPLLAPSVCITPKKVLLHSTIQFLFFSHSFTPARSSVGPPPSFLTALCFKILAFTPFCLLFLD